MSDTDRKLRLSIGIEVLQRFGREGTIIADRLLKEIPPECQSFDRTEFIQEVETRINLQFGIGD